MKSLSRLLLLAGLILFTATSLPAQRFISGGAAPSFSGGGGFGGGFGGYGGYGYGDFGSGYGFGGLGFGDCDLHRPQEHPPFGVSAAHGDPDFIQSTYMDYNKAVELGNKILEEQARPQPSLGEIARQLRARRSRTYVPPPAPGSGAAHSRPDSFVVIQDIHGKPVLCRSTDTACHNAA